jgi:flagellin-specific chaperone FliS
MALTKNIRNYIDNTIRSSDPFDRLILTYDTAIASCKKMESGRALHAIEVLIQSLNVDPPSETAMGLLRLYLYAEDLIHQGRHLDASVILEELRKSWMEVRIKLKGEIVKPPSIEIS